jgi:hypothetical protein
MNQLISEKGSSSSESGVGCLITLTIVFVVLKLTGLIDWSWWYVLLPFYAPIILSLLILGIALLIGWLEGEI